MSFYETFKKLKNISIEDIFPTVTSEEIKKVLQKNKLNEFDFLVLLSPAAVPYLDIMAQKAHENTFQHFNKKIIQPMDTTEYKDLVAGGVDGVTVYQEVYDEEMYKKVHVRGPKRNYQYRINTPERACKAGMAKVNMGVLLGLADWRKEACYLAMHVKYLQEKYYTTQIGLFFPRIKPHLGDFKPVVDVTDRHLIQMMLAMRLFLPECNMNLSTRESPTLRDELLSYGVTNMSAASCTAVGGYTSQNQKYTANHQFDISDVRSVDEIVTIIKQKGYQPV
ncbi:2-iminoacetate synthase ThiH [Chengkuizengella sp. SCS-71B]|uniref:2-iminoacetate synthase ThiH n=1 Tax=Chengkuizengella sp. SCS-71B TaxID=3115290 RepID=UPI0032C2275D